MKILVTGASGFIGGKVIDYLVKSNYFVIGCGRKEKVENVDNYFICDLSRDVPDIEADVIIHTAAMSPTPGADFSDYFENNVTATRNIIEYAKKNDIKRIIYLAAVSSYGEVDTVLHENSPHNNPNAYGLTKYIGEQFIKESNIPYYILILPGVVGDGCRDNWIMNAARTLCRGEELTYYNKEGMFNNILDVNDLCIFIERLLKKEGSESDIFLLGASEMMKMEEVILFLHKHLDSKSPLIENKMSRNSFYLDTNKAIRAGFQSSKIEDILMRVCENTQLE